jgi:hypothetical protein
MGGRTVQDNSDRHLAERPESLAARIKRAQEDAIEAKAVAQAYGLSGVKGEEEGHKEEAEAPSVVNQAMNQMNNMIKETNEMAKQKNEELKEARTDADQARADLFKTQLEIIQQMQGSLMDAQKRMQEQNSPEAAVATVERWEGIFSKFRPQPPAESNVAVAKASSDQTTIKLEEMKQAHEIQMEQMKGEREHQSQEFQLRMAQFNEETKRHYREYEDSVKLRSDAYGGFSDLVSAIAAGVDKERGGVATAAEEVIEAAVNGFRCQMCGTHIDIPEGAEKVTCPKPECGAEYSIRFKK